MYNTRFNDPATFAKVVRLTVKGLKSVKFDTVVFRGFSGAIVGPIVALRMKKKWALVRKAREDTHSSSKIEGDVHGDYVIECNEGRCVGVYLYDFNWTANIGGSTKDAIRKTLKGIPVINWQSF